MKTVALYMFAAFIAAQVIAIGLGAHFISRPDVYQVLENPGDPANSVWIAGYVLFSAALMLIILKYYKGKMFFAAVEFILMLFTLQTVLQIFVPDLTAFIVALAVVLLKFKYPHLRSALLLLATSVVGALVGTWIDLLPAAVLAILLSGYDIVAVFYTKHMIELAKGLENREASFSISFSLGDAKKVREHKRQLKSALETKPTKGEWKGEFIELGTGDIVIPATLAVAALKHSLPLSLAALAGSIIGMALLFYLLERRHGYWPALPPLAGCTLAAIGIGLAIGL